MWRGSGLSFMFLLGVLPLLSAGSAAGPGQIELKEGTLANADAVPFRARVRLTGTPSSLSATPAQQHLADLLDGRWEFQEKTGRLRVALNESGTQKRTLKPGGSDRIEFAAGDGKLELFFYTEGGDWFAAPARTLFGQVKGIAVELLDTDLDGQFAGDGDHVRVGSGAFRPCHSARVLPLPGGLARYALTPGKRCFSLGITMLPRPPEADDAMWRSEDALNSFRSGVGLPPVALDIARCDGCRKHARYLYLNEDCPATPLDVSHNEQQGKPGYTPEGHRAALVTMVSYDPDPAAAISGMSRTMLHRSSFLGAPEAGFAVGSVEGSKVDVPGYSVIWGADPVIPENGFPIFVPGPGQQGVPRRCSGEYPRVEGRPDYYDTPRGYPVGVSFGGIPLAKTNLALRDGRGREVAGTVFSPDAPITTSRHPENERTTFFVADRVLAPDARYEATFTAQLIGASGDRRPIRMVWCFTTGKGEKTAFE